MMKKTMKTLLLAALVLAMLSACLGCEKEVPQETTAPAGTAASTEATTTAPTTEPTTAPTTVPTTAPTTVPSTAPSTVPTEPVTTAPTQASTEPPAPPAPDTYTATVVNSVYDGDKAVFSITNVTSEGRYYTKDGLSYRVYYTTSGTVATTLCDFYPSDYGYVGAVTLNEWGDGPWYQSGTIKGHVHYEMAEDADGVSFWKAGAYYDLPDGAWFFGTANMDFSFIIVVNSPADEAAGTVPNLP